MIFSFFLGIFELSDASTKSFANFGQLAGAEKNKNYNQNDDQFSESDTHPFASGA